MHNKLCFILILAFFITGCGRLKGNFAFKKINEDVYRKINTPLEFDKKEKIDWIFVFSDVDNIYNIVITLLKKEVVWVDLTSRAEEISVTNKIIYGKIENLEEGLYKIILSNRDRIIEEKNFVIFSEDEEYYKYEN